MLSIIIPSRNERFLKRTIEDVLAKATGKIEVFPVLDGYRPPEDEIVNDPRVRYIYVPRIFHTQKRHSVNMAEILAQGKYLMCLDAHCMMAKGFDEVLAKDCKENWVMIPRRKRLDGKKWCIQPTRKLDVDYEFYVYPYLKDKVRHNIWSERTIERKDILVDETMMFQGSCWFMHRSHFKRNGFMQVEGYSGWGQNEMEEIALKTWLGGGKVMVNKKIWYAHLRKGNKYGRGYALSWRKVKIGNEYSADYWFNNRWEGRKHDLSWLIERFWPVPTWPEDRKKWTKP